MAGEGHPRREGNCLSHPGRVVIGSAKPELEGGRYLVKRMVGEKVVVTADIFVDGHDALSAVVGEEHLRFLLTFPCRSLRTFRSTESERIHAMHLHSEHLQFVFGPPILSPSPPIVDK